LRHPTLASALESSAASLLNAGGSQSHHARLSLERRDAATCVPGGCPGNLVSLPLMVPLSMAVTCTLMTLALTHMYLVPPAVEKKFYNISFFLWEKENVVEMLEKCCSPHI
jgi:hypothetical protein